MSSQHESVQAACEKAARVKKATRTVADTLMWSGKTKFIAAVSGKQNRAGLIQHCSLKNIGCYSSHQSNIM